MDFHHAPSFDAQLRASPAFRELLDRLTRCEMSNNAVQKELEIVHRSVNILIERTLAPSAINGEPEFKNPFASNAGSRSLTPSGGIGPLQQTPPHPSMKNDELSQISQRINTLTSSVGQLLALQTQHHMGSISHALGAQQGQMPPQPPMDIAPNQTMVSPSQASLLPLGIPNRPDLRPSPRMPNPPMRTWSAGTLDLPARLADVNLGRQDNVIRDKRRSVVSLVRRDSSGVCINSLQNRHEGTY
jgi:translation initiation factor 4A